MKSPIWKSSQNDGDFGWVAFLNNVVIDSTVHQFLQIGMSFDDPNPGGQLEYTTTSFGLFPQPLGIPYKDRNNYIFRIASTGEPPFLPAIIIWSMCGQDKDAGTAEVCKVHLSTSGYSMKPSIDTSIFLENFNTDPTKPWYKNFEKPFIAKKAGTILDIPGTIPFQWVNEYRITTHGCLPTSYPPIFNPSNTTGAIDGSLTYLGTAEFKKKQIPLRCP